MTAGGVVLLDAGLRGVATALDATAMSLRLSPLLSRGATAAPGPWRVASIKVLKHRPGRRCVLEYLLVGPGGDLRLCGKLFANRRGAAIHATLRHIAEAAPTEGLLMPRPLAYVADLRLLITEFVAGVPLARELYSGRSDEPARRAAAALAGLHRCRVEGGGRWSSEREIRNTAEWIEAGLTGAPRSATRARTLLERLEARSGDLPSAPGGTIHRDFYPEQLVDAGARVALVDLDEACRGDPAVDLGNFLAHLVLRSLQFGDAAPGCTRARGPFLAEYRACAGATAGAGLEERVGFYEATSLLRLAGVYGARQRWSASLPPRLLDACEAAGAALM